MLDGKGKRGVLAGISMQLPAVSFVEGFELPGQLIPGIMVEN
jgi:hypothetical protein